MSGLAPFCCWSFCISVASFWRSFAYFFRSFCISGAISCILRMERTCTTNGL